MAQICLKKNKPEVHRKVTWPHNKIMKVNANYVKAQHVPFWKCQVFETLTDSLGIAAYQTRVPSKHRNRSQRRKNRPFNVLPHIETSI
jgi:hypothetical protein